MDDNETNRRILQEMLTNWHMRPTVVADGKAALKALQEAREQGRSYQLILIDANMPEMDGYALAEEIKKHPELGNAFIMMLSSAGLRGDSAHCRELGLTAYLTKPVKPAVLLDAILAAVGISPEKRAQAPLITRHSLIRARARYEILLAEDNIINQKLAVKILENRGHRVTVVENGEEVLDALEKGPFDVILMDVQMPMMDGFQATREIRRREVATKAHQPIVAMTAHAMVGDREKCLEAGMDGYISKPLKPLDLLRTIDEILARRPREEEEEPVLPAEEDNKEPRPS